MSVIPAKLIQGNDELDTKLLRDMAAKAESYVRSYSWCLEVKEGKFTDGFGGIVALFLFRVLIFGFVEEKWMWVIVGDLPSAFLEKDGFNTPYLALERYLEGVDEWVLTARAGEPLDKLIPLGIIQPSEELLEKIEVRTEAVREHFLPHFSLCEY